MSTKPKADRDRRPCPPAYSDKISEPRAYVARYTAIELLNMASELPKKCIVHLCNEPTELPNIRVNTPFFFGLDNFDGDLADRLYDASVNLHLNGLISDAEFSYAFEHIQYCRTRASLYPNNEDFEAFADQFDNYSSGIFKSISQLPSYAGFNMDLDPRTSAIYRLASDSRDAYYLKSIFYYLADGSILKDSLFTAGLGLFVMDYIELGDEVFDRRDEISKLTNEYNFYVYRAFGPFPYRYTDTKAFLRDTLAASELHTIYDTLMARLDGK